jgi:hypothetical protein
MSTRGLPFRANGHETAVAEGTPVDVFELAISSRGASPDPGRQCWTCDQWLDLVITDDAVTVATPCPCPDGITTVITLAVPSGRIIVTDDLRPVYDWRDARRKDPPGMAGYNSALGQAQATWAMAAQGCAYGPVGNTSPGLYRTGDGTYAIASLDYHPDTDQEVLPAGWQPLASVCTDLWAYSVADYEDWLSRGGNPAEMGWSDTVVDVLPGYYELTHHTGERSFRRDRRGMVTFADIRYLGKGSLP